MIYRSQATKQMPLNIVGSSVFGRYPKISTEKTYNMFISDGFLVPYSGYQSMKDDTGTVIVLGPNGRAIFTSTILNKMVVVVGPIVYLVDIVFNPTAPIKYTLNTQIIGLMLTHDSDVYIAENNAGQIAITDGSAIYIYNPSAGIVFETFDSTVLGFKPGYITFHDTYFIAASIGTAQWRLSAQNDGNSWPSDASSVGELQTKPDNVVGIVRFPSKGNMIFVFGSNVTEAWFDVGYQLFPYQRNTSFNIDYGCVNASTIAATDELVVWLAKNEKSGPIIMMSDGGFPEKITTDGIDYFLSNLGSPQDSEAFIYRQDGHLFYHINFYTDNVSLFCDLETKKFFHACDNRYNYFIAREVAFFNNQYYFVSRNDGRIYAFDTIYTTYDDEVVPRIRVCSNTRLPTQDYFVINDLGFTVEQGVNQAQHQGSVYVNPRVDLACSYDGGQSFGNYESYVMNDEGNCKNMLRWWAKGLTNDFVPQFRFWTTGRVVATDGIVNIRQ